MKKFLFALLVLISAVPSSYGADTAMNALTDGTATVASTWYGIGYNSTTPYRFTLAGLLGLKIGTVTDTYICVGDASGKVQCTVAPTTYQTALTNPLIAGTMNTGYYCTKNAGSNTIDCNTQYGTAGNFVFGSDARGDMAVRGASAYGRVAKGSTYQLWRMADANDPGWSTATIDDSTSNVTKIANGTSSLQIKAGQALNFTGTFSDGKYCTYTSSGSVIACNSDAGDSTNVNALVTLSGVAAGSTNLGTFTGSTITDNQTVKASLQLLETAFEGLPGGHTQNTDTGTSRTTFLIDSGNTGVRVKNNSLTLEARNAADDAYAPFKALTIDGTTITASVGFSGALSGNATTATALASNPTDCSAGEVATGIAANGNLTCTATPSVTTITGALSGNATTATALAADPADCAAGQIATGINASGVAQCTATPSVTTITGNLTGNASGTAGGLSGTPNITVGTVSAGAAGFTVDADGDIVAKSVTITRVAGQASYNEFFEIPANGNSKVTLKGPDSLTEDYTSTLPANTGTLLSTGAAVTVAQGGSGVATITGPIKGNGTSAFSAAAYGDITGLWTTCTGYLKSDGTCDNPAGSGDVTGGATSATGEVAAYGDTGGKAIARSYVVFSGPSTSAKTKTISNGNDTIAEYAVANNFSAAQTVSAVNAASGSANALTLSGTLGIFNGSDTFRGLFLNYVNANHTGTGNSVALIDVPAITGDANSNFYGLRFGNFTGTSGAAGEVEQAINIGTGFDHGIYNLSPFYTGDGTNGLTVSAGGVLSIAGSGGLPKVSSTSYAATTSAELAGVISNETGAASGTPLLVFNQAPRIDSIELGADTDTTLARVSAGVVSIEGNNILTYQTTIDGSAHVHLTAIQMQNPTCKVSNYGQTTADVNIGLPAAAANLSCFFEVDTAQANHWGVLAGAGDGIAIIAADGTIGAQGTDADAVVMTAAQAGQSFACWSARTGASAWDWRCKSIAIGTSTFAAHAAF